MGRTQTGAGHPAVVWQSDPPRAKRTGKKAPPNVERRQSSCVTGGVEFAASHRLDGVSDALRWAIRKGFTFYGRHDRGCCADCALPKGAFRPEDMDAGILTEAIDEDYIATNPFCKESRDDESTTHSRGVQTRLHCAGV